MSTDQEAAQLAHELANHVGALLLGLDLLGSEPDLPTPTADIVSSLLKEAQTASALVTRLQQHTQGA